MGILKNAILHPEADNFDHNTCTLNGNNTFNGMGIIVAVTPKSNIYPIVNRRNVGEIDIKNLVKVAIVE